MRSCTMGLLAKRWRSWSSSDLHSISDWSTWWMTRCTQEAEDPSRSSRDSRLKVDPEMVVWDLEKWSLTAWSHTDALASWKNDCLKSVTATACTFAKPVASSAKQTSPSRSLSALSARAPRASAESTCPKLASCSSRSYCRCKSHLDWEWDTEIHSQVSL